MFFGDYLYKQVYSIIYLKFKEIYFRQKFQKIDNLRCLNFIDYNNFKLFFFKRNFPPCSVCYVKTNDNKVFRIIRPMRGQDYDRVGASGHSYQGVKLYVARGVGYKDFSKTLQIIETFIIAPWFYRLLLLHTSVVYKPCQTILSIALHNQYITSK